ncbi:MAG: glycosyltransferase family 4 protein, partial [Bacteroidota bacterium]
MSLTDNIVQTSEEDKLHRDKPLRVLMISEFPYKGEVVGGVQSAVEVLATALSRLPDIAKILVLSFKSEIDEDLVTNINDKLTIHHVAGQRRLTLPTESIFDFLKAKRIAKEFRPDVVHGQGTGAHGEIGVRLGYPSVLTIHGAGTFEVELRERDHKIIGPLRVWLTTKMTNRAIQNAGVLISISEFDKQHNFRFRTSNVVGIPNAVRQEFFGAEPTFPDSQRVIFNGLVIVRKNVVGLVRAFAKVKQHVPNAVLDIAGPTPDKGYYEKVLKNIDPAVKKDIIFHGNMKGLALPELIRKASVSVLFSIYENLPVAIAEAMALGKPVVCSRVGGVAEMVHDGENGFLVESEDEDALADRLVKLLTDPALRRCMGMKGYDMA